MAGGRRTIAARVDATRRRFARALFFDAAARGLAAGGAAALALAALSRLVLFPLAPAAAVAATMLAAAWVLHRARRLRPSLADTALLLDRVHGTGEALAAALEAREEEDGDPRIERALSLLARAPADPIPRGSAAALPAAALLILAASVFVLVPPAEEAGAPPPVAAAAIREAERAVRGDTPGVPGRPAPAERSLADGVAALAAAVEAGDERARDAAAARIEATLAGVAVLSDLGRALRAAASKPPGAAAGGGEESGVGAGTGSAGGLSESVRAARAALAALDDPALDAALEALAAALADRSRDPERIRSAIGAALAALPAEPAPGTARAVERALRASGAAPGEGRDHLLVGGAADPGRSPPAGAGPRAIRGRDRVDPRYEWLVRRYFSDDAGRE